MQEENVNYVKQGRVYRARADAAGTPEGKQSAQNRPVVLGYCAIRNIKHILHAWSGSRERLHACLNDFIEAVTEIVELEGGAVERFSGNGILFAIGHKEPGRDDLKSAVTRRPEDPLPDE